MDLAQRAVLAVVQVLGPDQELGQVRAPVPEKALEKAQERVLEKAQVPALGQAQELVRGLEPAQGPELVRVPELEREPVREQALALVLGREQAPVLELGLGRERAQGQEQEQERVPVLGRALVPETL